MEGGALFWGKIPILSLRQDLGLQCQTPLKDLNFTVTVVKTQVESVQIGKTLDLKQSCQFPPRDGLG